MSRSFPNRTTIALGRSHTNGRGRDEDCSSPPAQIPACAANAPGSSLGSNVGGKWVEPICGPAHSRANRIDVATRLCVRTTAVCQLFPLGEALPSPTSAGSCLPLFDRFISTMASSDFSSTYTLGVWLVAFPSRPGTKLRAWMRPPRFRQRTSPRAQGLRLREVPLMRAICHETMLPSPPQNEIGTSDVDPFRSSILGPWSPL